MDQREDWRLTDVIDHEMGRSDPFAAAIRATRMPMVIADLRKPDTPIVFANEAFQILTGYSLDEIIGRNCRFLQGPGTDRAAVAKIRSAIAEEQSLQVDVLNYRKDGSEFWNALYLSPTRGPSGDVQYYFASQLDVTARIDAQKVVEKQKAVVEAEVRRRTKDLEDALAAKTLLLHEVDHRVKNNLTLIGSLIRLQSRQIGDPKLAAQLDTMLERIEAIAAVHRGFYTSNDVSQFDVGGYTKTLVANLIAASGRKDICARFKCESFFVDSSRAASIGLIVNELTTNALKHGFVNGRGGTIHARIEGDKTQGELSIEDDGVGRSREQARPSGLGGILIARLAKQLGGSANWIDSGQGTQAFVKFQPGLTK